MSDLIQRLKWALEELAQHYPDLPGSPASGVHEPHCKWLCKAETCTTRHARCETCEKAAEKEWNKK